MSWITNLLDWMRTTALLDDGVFDTMYQVAKKSHSDSDTLKAVIEWYLENFGDDD